MKNAKDILVVQGDRKLKPIFDQCSTYLETT